MGSGAAATNRKDSSDLSDKLDKDPGCDQSIDHDREIEEAADDRKQSDDQQRDVRKVFGRVKLSEHFKEIAVERGCIRNAGIAEEQSKDRSERSPEHQAGENSSGGRSKQAFYKDGNDEVRFRVAISRNKFFPWHYANDGKIHANINDRDSDQADQNRSRNNAAGFFDFVADVTNIIVTEIIINADPRGRAKPEKKTERELEAIRREIESYFRIKIEQAEKYDDERCEQSSDPKRDRDFADRSDFTIEQKNGDNAHGDDKQLMLASGVRLGQHSRVIGKADVAGSNFERAAEDELPDKKKGHQAAPSFRSERFAKKNVSPARARQGGAEFAPDQAIRHADDHATAQPSID